MKDRNIREVKVNFYSTVRKEIPSLSRKKLKEIIKREVRKKALKELNIVVVGKRRIKKINREFLLRDRETDVISFNLGEIGEIYICREFVKDKEDFLRLIFHGFAHIMGYDHKKTREENLMKEYENTLLKTYLRKR